MRRRRYATVGARLPRGVNAGYDCLSCPGASNSSFPNAVYGRVIGRRQGIDQPVAKFFNRDLADLAHQLTLSPRRLRMSQVRAIEKLLAKIDESRAYPYEFVCHAITQYQKYGGGRATALIPGKALINDLISMAETLSRKSNLAVDELGESFQLHQELADELSISTKTVRRWRSRGLMGIRVVCEDGVNRLAFLRSTIDRFVRCNKGLVAKGAAFKQLSQSERDLLVDRARAILESKPLHKMHTIARAISEETGRAVETIRYTLRRFDEANPDLALFEGKALSEACERRLAIARCREAGESIESIAAAFDTDVDEVRLVLRQVEVQCWKDAPPECMPNDLFDAPDAKAIILDVPEPPAADAKMPAVPKGLPAYLRSLYVTPLLTTEQEQDVFRRYNFTKYLAKKALDRVDVDEPVEADCAGVRDLLAQADVLRQRIVKANLRLVVSIAKKHVGWSPNFFEVVSDGNVSLMRAVEKFDYARGNKFSTYATWAIMKNYARSIPTQHYHAARYVTGQDLVLETAADTQEAPVHESDQQTIRERIAEGLSHLTDRERTIVSRHFGLARTERPATLADLGRRFGVTKERVRQIEQKALARLREVLHPSLAEVIGG